MKSTCVGLLVVLSMAAPSQAAIMQFLPGTPDVNPLNVSGDGMFELSSVPNPAPNDFQYPAITSFDVDVIAEASAGGTMPVVFSLSRGSTRDGSAVLVFENPMYDELFVQFTAPGLSKGDPFPTTLIDSDGVVEWNAPSLAPPSTAPILAGKLFDSAIVPEPNSAIGMLIGLLTLANGIRLRQRK